LFATIQNSINYIWRIKVKDNLKMNIIKLLKDRVLSFGVILSLGFVLLVSLVIDAAVAFLKDFLTQYLSPDFVVMTQILNIAFSLSIVAVVFTLIFRFLPDVKVRWNASWFAGFFTAFLFSLGKILIGLLIGNNSMGAVYGAVSAFIAILAWVYYASIIFYIGVELSRQYSLYYKHDNEPSNYAVPFRISVIKDDKI
jgi:membrane protein